MEEEQSRKIGTGANFGPNFGTGANLRTMPNSCVRNPLSPPLLTFDFLFSFFFPFLPSLFNAF